jgi:hypothetical protein
MPARGFVPKQPTPTVDLTLRRNLIEKARRGEPLSDREMEIVRRASLEQQAGLQEPLGDVAAQAEAPAVAVPAANADAVPQGAVAVMGDGGKFYLVDAGGNALEEVAQVRRNIYSLPNGTMLQLADDGAGFEVLPGDLTTTSGRAADNLEASGVELSPTGARGRGRQKKGPSKIDKLADDIRQATTPAAGEEALANTKAIRARIDALQPEELDALLSHPSLAEGIESVAAKRDPAAREAAISRARERLKAVRNEPSTTDRAAGQLVEASQARDAARAPATANPAAPTARVAFEQARDAARSLLPAGDFNAAAAAYNGLSPDARAALLASSRDGTAKAILDAADLFVRRQNPDLDGDALMVARTKIQRDLKAGAALPDELVQSISAPTNELDALFINLNGAMKAGDTEAADALRAQIQAAAQLDPEAARQAQRSYLGRRALADGIGRSMQADRISTEAAALRSAEIAPSPRPVLAPGARQPEVQAFDRQPNEMPTDADEARSLGREAALERADRAPLGGMADDARREVFGDDLPVFLRGRDRNPPLETRRRNERPDTRDVDSVAKAEQLEQEVAQAQQAVDAAADPAARVAALARLQKAYSAIDKAYPPRLVNDRTGEVIARVTPAQRRGEGIPKGYRLETGRRAYADSSVNKASSQDTLEDLFFATTGFRRRGRRAISNTNADGMSAQDLGASLDDARLEFGDDVSEFIDDIDGDFSFRDEVNELLDTPPAGRKQQVRGGQPQQSRVRGSLERGFGGRNPLESGMTAEEVAREVASRVRGLRPGTATYEMMVERFAKAVQDTYGTPRNNPIGAMEARGAAPRTSRPEEPDATVILDSSSTASEAAEAYARGFQAAKKAGKSDDEAVAAGNAARKQWGQELKAARTGTLPPVSGDDLPATSGSLDDAASTPAATPEDAKLDASATDLGAVEGDLPAPSPAAQKLDAEAMAEIQARADVVRDEAYEAGIANGLSKRKAQDEANALRKAYVDEQVERAKRAGASAPQAAAGDLPPPKGDVDAAPAESAQAVPDPEIGRVDPADLPPAADDLPPPAGDVDAPAATPDADTPPKAGDDLPAPEGDLEADRPRAEGDTPPRGRDGDEGGRPAPESLLRRIRNAGWKWGSRAAIGGGVLWGLGRLAGTSNAPGGPHVPPPGAGGGGGGGGNGPPGGLPVPFPPGGQPGAGDPVAAAEAEIEAALESLRRGENLTSRPPQYQTFQQYNQFG